MVAPLIAAGLRAAAASAVGKKLISKVASKFGKKDGDSNFDPQYSKSPDNAKSPQYDRTVSKETADKISKANQSRHEKNWQDKMENDTWMDKYHRIELSGPSTAQKVGSTAKTKELIAKTKAKIKK